MIIKIYLDVLQIVSYPLLKKSFKYYGIIVFEDTQICILKLHGGDDIQHTLQGVKKIIPKDAILRIVLQTRAVD